MQSGIAPSAGLAHCRRPSTLLCQPTARPGGSRSALATVPNVRTRGCSQIKRGLCVPRFRPDGQPDAPAAGQDKRTAMDVSAPAKFVWTQFWYPLAPIDTLDTSRPTKFTLLGQDLAVWYSKATDTWSVMKDQCPHRLAPLSEGRIIGSNLVCSYHGWAFEPSGQCASIPQAPADQQATICANKHSCASSYPTSVQSNILYVWMDNSPEGLELSKARGVTGIQGGKAQPHALHFPVSARMWLEQGWDPTHANQLHHGMGLSMDDTIPIHTHNVSKVDLKKGFSLEHGGYENKNPDVKVTRIFVPPCHYAIVYWNPSSTFVMQYSVMPATPDSCNTVGTMHSLPGGQQPTLLVNGVPLQVPPPTEPPGSMSTPPKDPEQVAKKPQRQLLQTTRFLSALKLPHWVMTVYGVLDQDLVVMAQMEHKMATGQSSKAYHVAVKDADMGVVLVNRWLKMAGYPEAAFPSLDQSTLQAAKFKDMATLEKLLDRRTMHVNHCTVCQQGLQLVTRICWTVTVASGLLAAFSTSLAAQAIWSTLVEGAKLSPDVLAPVAGSLLFAGLLAAAASKLWDYREFTFISGARAWRKQGGLSLVPRV